MIILLFFLAYNPCLAQTSDFNSPHIEIESRTFSTRKNLNFESATPYLSQEYVKKIFLDTDNRIMKDFRLADFYDDSVKFWFSIYTQYSSKQVVIHDKTNLGIVYKAIDFSGLNQKGINSFTKAILQAKLAQEYIRSLTATLKAMGKKTKYSQDEKNILKILAQSGEKIPKASKQKQRFFFELAKNLRTQTGQRDMIQSGLLRAYPFYPFLETTLSELSLPKELIAIAFLESSFNPKAESKVSAVGIWQLMPFIARLIMPRNIEDVDYRKSPIVATFGALHILKENKLNLKRWDLAITAYNSGTKNIRKAQKKYKRKDISLEFILKNFEHPTLQFASKNFYSSFLALVHTLAYKESIFPLKGHHELKNKFNKPKEISLYVTKCALNFKSFKSALRRSSPHVNDLNLHLSNKTYPKGLLIASDLQLTSKRYTKVNPDLLKRYFPKKYLGDYKNTRCLK